ncbi:hypothetical protein [Rhizobium grahamii]|uniref:Uncharacterized protein n=1 Tax=Rhizobium grahamii CCGE 502 TaxID=990285 RepID=S3IL79_9HYPH|nr:hypothetical protein [Rhizobium grahamii]EPE99548.1 hypothetical protein RGCCGE502_05175 [Rhizobium grahamii CCGE 502]
MFSKFIPDEFKLPAIAVAGAMSGVLAAYYPAKLVGRHEERQAVEIEAAKEALDRIHHLEKNNASFNKLSDRDRCLVFMRDSGLPDSACD